MLGDQLLQLTHHLAGTLDVAGTADTNGNLHIIILPCRCRATGSSPVRFKCVVNVFPTGMMSTLYTRTMVAVNVPEASNALCAEK
jgi:hypothetical protein